MVQDSEPESEIKPNNTN